MSISCPACGLFAPDEATRCDCGYRFGDPIPRGSRFTRRMRADPAFRSTVTRTACVIGGFITQFLVLGLIMEHGLPGGAAQSLVGLLLSPGVMVFAQQGFHSDIAGFMIAVVVNTVYYGALLFGVAHTAFKGRRPIR